MISFVSFLSLTLSPGRSGGKVQVVMFHGRATYYSLQPSEHRGFSTHGEDMNLFFSFISLSYPICISHIASIRLLMQHIHLGNINLPTSVLTALDCRRNTDLIYSPLSATLHNRSKPERGIAGLEL